MRFNTMYLLFINYLDKEIGDKIWILHQGHHMEYHRKQGEDCYRLEADLEFHHHMSMNKSPTYQTGTIHHLLFNKIKGKH